MSESIQQLILNTLDVQGSIADTRSLTIPGESHAATSHDAQLAILGALNSLLSREVSVSVYGLDGVLNAP